MVTDTDRQTHRRQRGGTVRGGMYVRFEGTRHPNTAVNYDLRCDVPSCLSRRSIMARLGLAVPVMTYDPAKQASPSLSASPVGPRVESPVAGLGERNTEHFVENSRCGLRRPSATRYLGICTLLRGWGGDETRAAAVGLAALVPEELQGWTLVVP